MHMMSIFCLATDGVSSGCWFIVFKVLALKVTLLTMFFAFKFGLGSVTDFWTLGLELQLQLKVELTTLVESDPKSSFSI